MGRGQSAASGGEVATFTRRFGRWLPTPIAAVSPDSSHYAYDSLADPSTYRRAIHVVDVASGNDRVVYQQDYYAVLDYRSEGVYLVSVGPVGEAANGLWLLNPTSGSLLQIESSRLTPGEPFGFYLIGAGAAWYGDVAPGDQPPNSGIGPMDRVVRFDLTTHASTPWFRLPGWQLQATGFDGQDHLIVVATTAMAGIAVQPGQGSLEVWIVDGPGNARQIYSTSKSQDFVGFFGPPLADDHGVWFGSPLGIFLYTTGGKFEKVSDAAGDIAGRCS